MQRSPLFACLSSLLCVALGCSAATRQDADRASAPQSEASQAAAATADVAITQANVYENERYWPAIVALTQEWLPPGETKPAPGAVPRDARPRGSGRPRPNRFRSARKARHPDGSHRSGPACERGARRVHERSSRTNFVLRVGNSLVDSSSQPMRPHTLDEIAGASGYLCIFADPRAEDFPTLARAARSARRREWCPDRLLPAVRGARGSRVRPRAARNAVLARPLHVSAAERELHAVAARRNTRTSPRPAGQPRGTRPL